MTERQKEARYDDDERRIDGIHRLPMSSSPSPRSPPLLSPPRGGAPKEAAVRGEASSSTRGGGPRRRFRVVWVATLTSVAVVVVQQSQFAQNLSADVLYPDVSAATVAALLATVSGNYSSSLNRLGNGTHPHPSLRPSSVVSTGLGSGSLRESIRNGSQDGPPEGPPPPSSSFNVSHHVVRQIPEHVARGNRTSLPTIPVVVWPLWEFGVDTAEAIHLEQNAIHESPYLELSHNASNFDPNVVWIGDTGSRFKWKEWCGKFQVHVERAVAERRSLGLPTSWPIFIVDWTDYYPKQKCPRIEALVGRDNVFYNQRSIVNGRYWDDERDWVVRGKVIELKDRQGRVYKHTPLVVRTDTVRSLNAVLQQRGKSLRDALEAFDRPVDVSHLWPTNPTAPGAGVGDIHSKLRTRVSRLVEEWGRRSNATVFVGLAGAAVRTGRRGVRNEYLEALLRTKIVVVTQRDRWEDHYRLFEALTSGAMVMTDRMLSLPAGIENGTSIVEFGSKAELLVLLEYFLRHPEERLEIARRGRRVAMLRHRTWHRIEEIVFGRALTVCSFSSEADAGGAMTTASGGDCPYIVHANETSRRIR